MKKYAKVVLVALCLSFTVLPSPPANAAIPGLAEIIRAGVIRVIKAVDLKIQRLQNKTIWLQNAQKVYENILSETRLNEITDWTERQREQYRVYYEELRKVKGAISYYKRIRTIMEKQIQLVNEYNRAWSMIRQDRHFSDKERAVMAKVYAGILSESAKNMEQISDVVRSFSLQMSDAERLELINEAADRVDSNFDDLMRFNRENYVLSFQRAASDRDIEVTRKLYGIN